jgi:hypothetical protein
VQDPGNDTVSQVRHPLGRWFQFDHRRSEPAGRRIMQHTYADNGAFAVTVGSGGRRRHARQRRYGFGIAVNDVPPCISISGSTSSSEGANYALTLGNVTDPGDDSVLAVHHSLGRWQELDRERGQPSGRSCAQPHVRCSGSFAITVDLVNEDGTTRDRANALAVAVCDVPPVIMISGNSMSNEGSSYALTLGAGAGPRRRLGRPVHHPLG